MDFLVLVKPVPIVEDVQISSDARSINTEELKFFINEADSFALEEAILKKEQLGGTVTVVTLAESEIEDQVNEMIWECYAKGADKAFFIINDGKYLDVYAKSKVFSEFAKNRNYDLILTGVQSSDTNYSLLGPLVAKSLGIPYGTLVSKLEIMDGKARVNREMEEGYLEAMEYKIPALFTVQTGINTPRYPPFIKIRNAKQMPIEKLGLGDLVQNPDNLIRIRRDKVFVPESKGKVRMMEGDPASVSRELAEIIRKLGVTE